MSSGRYARETAVPVAKSRQEIEQLLRRYGAVGFASVWDDTARRHLIEFKIPSAVAKGTIRQVRLIVPYPDPQDPDIQLTPGGRARTEKQVLLALEQADRQRWRQVKILIHAKLEAVQVGISTLEREFLADVVVPELGGATIAEQLAPQLMGGRVLQLPAAT